MDSDEEDFVFYGTPIEREEDVSSRKKKAIAEASGQLKTLPAWKQEVRDDEGRRRFHGAFTGGFSAGYYNTVGTKEGWAPQSFTSSRKNRADFTKQSILNFLDEDEKEELEGRSLGTSMQYDTFGFTAAEFARKQAEKEQKERPSAIPGPVPNELLVPATDSIGVKLLKKMGWREGQSIKESTPNSRYDARREARKAFLALSSGDAQSGPAVTEHVEGDIGVADPSNEDDTRFSRSTPVYVLNPKQDLYGLGYDPFKHAPEFREKKRLRLSNKEMGRREPFAVKDGLFGFKSGSIAPGFGIGALEDLDVEDEDVYASGIDLEGAYVEEIEEPVRAPMEDVKMLKGKEKDILPGFKAASNSEYQLERFQPPAIPKDFVPHHKFTAPLEVDRNFSDACPPDVTPPEDNNLKVLIEGVATLVARCGKLFEDLSREKNQSNPLFGFLNGGVGHEYYVRKLWEERQKRNRNKQQLDEKIFQNAQRMTAESRGKILGEKPLERSLTDTSSSVLSTETINLQYNLSDSFTKPTSFSELPEVARPFRDDPEKQERFEQFLKDKYQGGLRPKDYGAVSKMSEAARARERLEFEAAAEALDKGKWGEKGILSSQWLKDISSSAGLQFTSGGLEHAKIDEDRDLELKKFYPKREEFQWRPSPLLCKRFDLIDPYMGKPPPAPRSRSKMDSLIVLPDSIAVTKADVSTITNVEALSAPKTHKQEKSSEITAKEVEAEVQVENVERPVDLYKAIFSDDSDGEEENTEFHQVEEPQKQTEAVNSTLNRLIAGDFLESLGKELGLEVPPDLPPANKVGVQAFSKGKENSNARNGENDTKVKNKVASDHDAPGRSISNPEVPRGSISLQKNSHGDSYCEKTVASTAHNDGKTIGAATIESKNNRKYNNGNEDEKPDLKGKVSRNPSVQHRNRSDSSSENERSREGRHQTRGISSSDSDASDYSDESRDRHRSRSKKKRSREKSSRRHRKHKHRRDSPSRSRHGSGKEYRESKRERRRYKD